MSTLLVGSAALLAGCGERAPQFKSTDITGAQIGGELALADHTGKARKLSDFKGKVVVVFFGYTQWPDVCPTTMSELAAAMKELGAKAKDVQVLDKQGRIRLFIPHGAGPAVFAHDLAQLLG